MIARILRWLTVSLVVLLALSAYAQDDEDNTLGGTIWQLVSLDGEPVLENTAPTLILTTDGRATGSGGCNSFGGSYTVEGEDIGFAELFSTMMACLSDETMTQERAYLSALMNATGYALDDGQLTISYGDGQQLVFEPLLTLAGSAWMLVSLGGDDLIGEQALTLTFEADENFNGFGGCNVIRGTYTTNETALDFGEVAVTRRACVDEDLELQEQAYIDALEAASRYDIDDDTLTISYGDGRQLAFERMRDFTDVAWQLESYGGEDVLEDTEIILEFEPDNQISGSSGCNLYGGTYTVEDDTLTFTDLANTERACMQPGIMEQEQQYLQAMRQATRYALDAGRLIIFYEDGQELIFAPRGP